MKKRGLIIGLMLILMLITSSYALSQYVKTKVIFNIQSNPQFIVTVNNNTWTNALNTTSSGTIDGAETSGLIFISVSGTDSCIYPNTDYATKPTFKFYNTGNEILNFNMKLESALPSLGCIISLYADENNDCIDGTLITDTDWTALGITLMPASTDDLWLYANTNSCSGITYNGTNTYIDTKAETS